MKLRDFADAAGCSRRRVQLWSDTGLFDTEGLPGTGNHRSFQERDIGRARILNLLSDLGVTLGVQTLLVGHLEANPKDRSTLEHLREVIA